MSFLLELDDSLDVDTLELIDEEDWQDVVLECRPNAAIVPASVTLDCNPNKRAKTDKECSHNAQAAAKTPHQELTSRKLKKKRPRNKQKIQELRMEIAKLEEQLSQLQRRKGFFSGTSSEDWDAVKLEALLWRDAAAGLQKERLHAEASNTMLRKLLAAQVEFSTSLAKIAGMWEASAFDD